MERKIQREGKKEIERKKERERVRESERERDLIWERRSFKTFKLMGAKNVNDFGQDLKCVFNSEATLKLILSIWL